MLHLLLAEYLHQLLEILVCGRFAFQPIYPVIYLQQHGPVDICFTLWVIIQC